MQASTVCAYIGLACSCVLIAALLLFCIVDFKSVNRVTIRLVIGIVIADFMNHIVAIYGNGTKDLLGTSYCAFLASLKTLDRHLYAFTNIAICYHLYRVIVQLKKPSFKSELAIWIVLLLFILILLVIYHFLGVFSGIQGKKACNPGADNPTITKAVWGLIGVFNLIAIISGIYVTIVCHKSLDLWIETYSGRKFSNPEEQKEFKSAKLRATKRSFLYPLAALITLSAEVVLCAWMVFDNPPLMMYTISSCMMGFKGVLTLIAFSLDQAVWSSAKSTYLKLTDTQMGDI